MIVETEKCSISMKMASPEDVSEVLAHIGTCLRKIFPGLSPVRIMKKVSMEPSERLASLQALWDSQTVAEQGPCGGFSQMYACVCDWLGFSYREEVQWDVDTIYLTQDTRELNLQDFSHLDHRKSRIAVWSLKSSSQLNRPGKKYTSWIYLLFAQPGTTEDGEAGSAVSVVVADGPKASSSQAIFFFSCLEQFSFFL
ncbi:capping protein regulator and myosin 1 linker 1 [Homo sapiens]|uniref:Capping protein regulator and myosin 1 linker 1 n=2 Tax=Homo sapiens TaxID=9606 RepID=A0A0U1RR91_HUMAN|nr:capping protein regulator and myosin 1 linker 1 [Homo sapiens]KAI4017022.1 capping protein regulator and myosin 1 linker 1 [Homo sapiens]